MIIPTILIESIVPLTAGLVISLFNKYIINRLPDPPSNSCCEPEIEIIDEDDSSIDSTKTEKSDTSKNSSLSVATMQPHQVHTVHHYYVHN
jgi:hypothetical protein